MQQAVFKGQRGWCLDCVVTAASLMITCKLPEHHRLGLEGFADKQGLGCLVGAEAWVEGLDLFGAQQADFVDSGEGVGQDLGQDLSAVLHLLDGLRRARIRF